MIERGEVSMEDKEQMVNDCCERRFAELYVNCKTDAGWV